MPGKLFCIVYCIVNYVICRSDMGKTDIRREKSEVWREHVRIALPYLINIFYYV